AAGDVDIDGYYQIDAFDDVVAVFVIRPAATGAGAHRDDEFRIGHRVEESADAAGHFKIDRTRHDHEVGLARCSTKCAGAEPVHVIARCTGRHHLDGATRQAECHGPKAGLPGPIYRLLQRRGNDAFLETTFENAHEIVTSLALRAMRRLSTAGADQSAVC